MYTITATLVLSRDAESQRIAEVAQQTLTDFVQALVNACLDSVQERLQREVHVCVCT